jgi:hypothetical protein
MAIGRGPRLLRLILGGALLLAAPGGAQVAPGGDPNGFVECRVGDRSVYKPRRQCPPRDTIVRDRKPAGAAQNSGWAALDAESGVTRVPVVACRSRAELAEIGANRPENRAVLTRLAVKRGRCTRLAAHTGFAIANRGGDALQIRTAEQGRLWVAPDLDVPDLARLPLAGRLEPDPSDGAVPAALTPEEQQAVDAELAQKKTVPGFVGRVQIGGPSHVPGVRDGGAARKAAGPGGDDGHRRSCLCANGQTISADRSCDEACDVQASFGSNDVDRRGCHYRGELMPCQESGRRKAEDRMRRGY